MGLEITSVRRSGFGRSGIGMGDAQLQDIAHVVNELDTLETRSLVSREVGLQPRQLATDGVLMDVLAPRFDDTNGWDGRARARTRTRAGGRTRDSRAGAGASDRRRGTANISIGRVPHLRVG